MSKFRKKPVVVEAMQFTGENIPELDAFTGGYELDGEPCVFGPVMGVIPTLEGQMSASVGDWIIRGVKGEFYPCKPDIFAATYEPVDEDDA